MSVLERTQDHLTTVWMNGCSVVVHRDGCEAYGPALVTVRLGVVTLSLEDVAALLFDWLCTGVSFAEVDDDATTRRLVAESVLNRGCLHLEDARADALRADATTLAYCRQRALTVFKACGDGAGEGSW